jgi:hypothetical protein
MALSPLAQRTLEVALANPEVGKELAAAVDAATVALASGAALPVDIPRASLLQASLKHVVPLTDGRVWDALATMVVGTPANDDLGLVTNTPLTSAPTIETGDLKAAGATTRRVAFQYPVPENYVAGQAITLVLNAGMKTTVADVTATIDAEVTRNAAPSVDICATAAQTINSLVAADKSFTVTPTNVVVGDLLYVRISIAVNDAATATAVIGQLNEWSLTLASKG